MEAFKAGHYLDDEAFAVLQTVRLPAERKIQDYRSSYNDIREWQRRERDANTKDKKGHLGAQKNAQYFAKSQACSASISSLVTLPSKIKRSRLAK